MRLQESIFRSFTLGTWLMSIKPLRHMVMFNIIVINLDEAQKLQLPKV